MRVLLPAPLVLAALPRAVPTREACHVIASPDSYELNILNSPDEPRAGPANFHRHECGDGHAWSACTRALNERVQTW